MYFFVVFIFVRLLVLSLLYSFIICSWLHFAGWQQKELFFILCWLKFSQRPLKDPRKKYSSFALGVSCSIIKELWRPGAVVVYGRRWTFVSSGCSIGQDSSSRLDFALLCCLPRQELNIHFSLPLCKLLGINCDRLASHPGRGWVGLEGIFQHALVE